jgi:hypothetical protein
MPPDPPGYPPAQALSGGMSTGVKALIALVVLAVVGVGAFVLLGGDDDGGGRNPEQAVRDFLAAAQDRNCEGMLSLVSEASWSQNGELTRDEALERCATEVQAADFVPAGARIAAVEVTSQRGDTAEVEVTSTSDEQGEVTETIPLVKQDGRWLVDFATQFEDTTGTG